MSRRRLVGVAIVGASIGFAATSSVAQSTTPAGLWKTIDDNTKQEKSLVRITESNGIYTGKVVKITDPEAPPDAICKDCTDERKDKPIVGLTIIRNVKPSPGEPGVWDGGDILDPSNGKVYRVKLQPIDNGAKLDVRGYIGISLFGRTQTWIRAE